MLFAIFFFIISPPYGIETYIDYRLWYHSCLPVHLTVTNHVSALSAIHNINLLSSYWSMFLLMIQRYIMTFEIRVKITCEWEGRTFVSVLSTSTCTVFIITSKSAGKKNIQLRRHVQHVLGQARLLVVWMSSGSIDELWHKLLHGHIH